MGVAARWSIAAAILCSVGAAEQMYEAFKRYRQGELV